MNLKQLLLSANSAIAGLVTANVIAVAVGWEDKDSCITLRYYLSHEPTEEEREMCSCALAELEAEFSPYINTAIDECLFSTKTIEQLDPLSGWGYVKQ